MAEYVLEKGKKPGKDTIRVQDYLVGELYVADPTLGYIERKNCSTNYDFIYNYGCKKGLVFQGKIIIKNTPAVKLQFPTKVKEFLTGTELDLLSYRLDPITKKVILTRASGKELSTFVYLFNPFYPTVEQLWNYIQEHKDVDEYKEQLASLINQGQENAIIKKEEEQKEKQRAKEETLSIRRIS